MGNDSPSLNGMSSGQKQFKYQTSLAHKPPVITLVLCLSAKFFENKIQYPVFLLNLKVYLIFVGLNDNRYGHNSPIVLYIWQVNLG